MCKGLDVTASNIALASGLIGAGMNWKQALLTILLGNTIVLVPILPQTYRSQILDQLLWAGARGSLG